MAHSDQPPARPDFERGVALAAIPQSGMLPGRVGDQPVLLSRSADGLHAVSGACTHYGGPLAKGLAGEGWVRCPWHHACFDLRTGEALAAPAFAPLRRWRVEIAGDMAFVREPLEAAIEARSSPLGVDVGKIVIVGGGAAGFAAADQLRRLGYTGGLTVLSADAEAPYDRPNLSKDYLAGSAPADWMPLKDADYYAARAIDLRLGVTVTGIDVAAREVVAADGVRFAYDRLLLATGAEPVRLDTPGFDHAHVRTLRSMADAEAIIALARTAERAVVIGASFIGLEVAAALRERGLAVDVVAPETLPMEKVLGRDLALHVKALHEQHGVAFHLQRKAVGFDGHHIVLDSGERLAAGLVVVGVGVMPRTDLAKQAGLAIGDGILVDGRFRTSSPGIFAAGDIAAYPDPLTGAPVRVEHWVLAERQGQVAAGAMLGGEEDFVEAPFFWSHHYDLTIRYVGRGAGWDRTDVDGSIAGGDCTVRYFAGDRLVAAATIGRDRENLELAAALSAWPGRGGG